MPVTEFALMHLAGGPLDSSTRQLFEECQNIQDGWALKQNPREAPTSRLARGVGMLQQVEDPSAILITARWDSPEAHWDWIGTEENKGIMEKMGPLIVAEGEKKMLLFHVDPVVLPEVDDESAASSPLSSPILSIYRYSVKPTDKKLVAAKFDEVSNVLRKSDGKYDFKSGWRIEKQDEGTEELLVFHGWTSIEEHEQFQASGDYAHFKSLAEHAKKVDPKLYQKFI